MELAKNVKKVTGVGGGGGGYRELWPPGRKPLPPPSMKNVKRDSGGGPGSEPAMVNLNDLVKGSGAQTEHKP